MYRSDWKVTNNAAENGACPQCDALLGEQHHEGCLRRCKSVVAQVTYEIVLNMPESWTFDEGNKILGETYCGCDFVTLLIEEATRTESCMNRQLISAKVIRNASAEDELSHGMFIAEEELH